MPEISIIVPVYNVEDKICRCLDSVIAQTFLNYELILVDDGSPDKSGEICDSYAEKHKRIKVIHKQNGGLSDARNAGLKIANGNYIMFLDSDDYITPDCLSTLHKNNADLVIGTIYWAYENGNTISQVQRADGIIRKGEYKNILPDLLGERRLNYVHAKLYSRKIIVQNGICFEDDMLTSAEDTVFNFTFLKYCNSIYISGHPVHYYMQCSTGLARRFYKDRYQRSKRLNHYIVETCKFLSIYNEQMKLQIDNRKVFSAIWCIDGIIAQKNLSLHEKRKLLDAIFFDDELKSAILCVNVADYDDYDDFKYLMKYGSRKFLLYKKAVLLKRKVLDFASKFN